MKVIADQTVWSIYLNAVYSFFIGSLALRDPREVWQDIKSTSWPALRTSWRFWPFVHSISFSHAVPLDLKLLWVDVMEIVWVTLLSKVANDDKDAAKAAAEDPATASSVVDGGIAEPATELAMTLMSEREVCTVIDGQKVCSLDTTVIPEEALSSKLTGLAAKGWKASWPLVAMWPWLYGSHSLETMLLH